MTHAVEIEDLARLAEGTLSRIEQERIRLHVGDCVACRSQLSDLRAIDRMVASADEGPLTIGASEAMTASLEERLDAILKQLLRTERTAKPVRRPWWTRPRWITGFVAIAASIILVVMLRETDAAAHEVRGRVVVTSDTDVVRSGRQPTFHFELTLGRTGFLAIFQASAQGLRLIFPHPNPVLGTFGMTSPIPKDTVVRIPPSAVADYPRTQIPSGARLLAVVLTEAPTTASMQAIADQINRSGVTGPDALQQALAARLGPITVLEGP